MTDHPDPRQALADIQAARRSLSARVADGGWRYDLAYAAIVAGMASAQALDAPFNVAGSTVGLLVLLVIFRAETRRLGVRITGVSPRRARWVAIAMGLLMAAVMLTLVALKRRGGVETSVIVAVAMPVAFVVALAGSRLWRRVYRAEMGAGA